MPEFLPLHIRRRSEGLAREVDDLHLLGERRHAYAGDLEEPARAAAERGAQEVDFVLHLQVDRPHGQRPPRAR